MKTVIRINTLRSVTSKSGVKLLWQFLPMKWIKSSVKNIRVTQRKESFEGIETAERIIGATHYWIIEISFQYRVNAKHQLDIESVLWHAPFNQYYDITLTT